MTTAFYRTGTVAVTQNSKVVTGTGTNWTTGPTKPLAGDVFIFNNKMYEIDSVVSDTEIRLYRNFEDSTASSKSYAIMRNASLNISARIAAQVAQVVNQKQIMIDEFHDFLTNNTDSTVPLTDTLGNTINVTPIPMLDKDYVEKIGGIDAAVNQAIQDINDKFDSYEYILMREAEARAIQWQNENVNFDASGFVHMGKHYNPSILDNVNEGVFTSNSPNKFSMGRSTSEVHGESKTDFSVVNIAGAVSNVLTESNYTRFQFELPEAEDGTRIYDSTGDARGSGEASLDLKVDVDPKYGDVPTGTEAEILREAVGRAFEGQVKNGDFRLGDNGDWEAAGSEASTITIDATGIRMSGNTTNGNYAQSAPLTLVDTATEYEFEVTVENALREVRVMQSTSGSSNFYTLPVTTERTVYRFSSTLTVEAGAKLTFSSAIGGNDYWISNVSVKPVTEEVVTHPVDLVGLEYYEEELTGRQEIFECIQSLSTTFGTTSVPTVLSTRKLSYFQQYDGQFPEVTADPDYINDRYRCVVWDDLTEPQKREVAAYIGEKLFKGVNGHIVNGRLRARTIRGAVNGDWVAINPLTDAYAPRQTGAVVIPQGKLHTPTFVNSNQYYYSSQNPPSNIASENFNGGKGIYQIRPSSGNFCAYKGRCFLHVVATVPRANQGAYHPDLNPWGSAQVRKIDDLGGGEWWQATNPAKYPLSTMKDCYINQIFGDIASGKSGHPDGIFYDGIEAGGLNGVIDWRLPAVASDSPEEAAKVEAKVENGTYRGLEKLVWTKFHENVYVGYIRGFNANHSSFFSSENDNGSILSFHSNGMPMHTPIMVAQPATGLVGYGSVSPADGHLRINRTLSSRNSSDNDQSFVAQFTLSDPIYVAEMADVSLSVSGEFNTQMVIGDPANILQTDALKDGWLGTWCPVIPDGTSKAAPLTRKLLAELTRQNTANNGAAWSSGGFYNYDPTTNTDTVAWGDGHIYIMNYTAFAKQTKPSTNKPVYNTKAGLMDVTQLSRYNAERGCVFTESLIGKVVTNGSSSDTHSGDLALTYSFVDGQFGSFLNPSDHLLTKHVPLTLGAPINNSPAVKVLPYQISNNGQGSIGYQANELIYDENPTVVNITDNNIGEDFVEGTIYRVTKNAGTAVMDGRLYYCTTPLSSLGWDSSQWYIGKDGEVKRLGKNETYLVPFTLGWGDDSTIKITEDGSDTFVDLNGNTNLSVVHELAIPYTWTSNHARAGVQVEGVDL